jgi:hypothetical protein
MRNTATKTRKLQDFAHLQCISFEFKRLKADTNLQCTTTHKVDSGLCNVAARRFDLIRIDGPTKTRQHLTSSCTGIIGHVQISTSCEQRMYGGQVPHLARCKQ